MSHTHDTFACDIQLGASRERLKDAEALHNADRYTGAIYLAGYAIECSLKALICIKENQDNFKNTEYFKEEGSHGASLHNLRRLREELARLDRYLQLDSTQTYEKAWAIIVKHWQKDELRYSTKSKQKDESEKFLAAVKKMYELILNMTGRNIYHAKRASTTN